MCPGVGVVLLRKVGGERGGPHKSFPDVGGGPFPPLSGPVCSSRGTGR